MLKRRAVRQLAAKTNPANTTNTLSTKVVWQLAARMNSDQLNSSWEEEEVWHAMEVWSVAVA